MSSYRTSPMSSSETETDEPERSVLMRVQDKYTTVALTMAFLLYSTISTVIFRVRFASFFFVCVSNPNRRS